MAKKITDKPKDKVFKKIDLLLLGIIVILAFAMRLYKIDNPVADWHSWRQADTAAVGRNFARNGFDLMHPRYDDLGSNQTGHDNPQGYRFVEFPFYSATFGAIYRYMPILSLEVYARATTAFFSLLIIAALYYLVLAEENRIAAFFAALIYAAMPFFVYYSRVILPETTALALMFGGIFFLYLWHKKKETDVSSVVYFVLSIALVALSLLTKPTTIFYLLAPLYIFYKKWGFSVLKKISMYGFFILCLLPFGLWRIWIQHFPEGIPASGWLITSVNTYEGQKNIFFGPAFFRWIFYERLLNLILGGYLITFYILGIIKKPKKSFLLFSVVIASFIYLFTFQGGNVQHDYYQTIILPTVAIACGVGIGFLYEEKKSFTHSLLTSAAVLVVLIFSFLFSYYKVKDYYWTDPDLLNVAKTLNTVTESGSKIVTDRDGDTTLLYLADRKGYAAVTEDLGGLKNKGMQYFITLHKEVADKVRKQYKVIFENDKMFVFKL